MKNVSDREVPRELLAGAGVLQRMLRTIDNCAQSGESVASFWVPPWAWDRLVDSCDLPRVRWSKGDSASDLAIHSGGRWVPVAVAESLQREKGIAVIRDSELQVGFELQEWGL